MVPSIASDAERLSLNLSTGNEGLMLVEVYGLDLMVWLAVTDEAVAERLGEALSQTYVERCKTGRTVIVTFTEDGKIDQTCLGEMSHVTFTNDGEKAHLHLKDGTQRVLTIEPSPLTSPEKIEHLLRNTVGQDRQIILCQTPRGEVVAVDRWELPQRPSTTQTPVDAAFEAWRHNEGYRDGMMPGQPMSD